MRMTYTHLMMLACMFCGLVILGYYGMSVPGIRTILETYHLLPQKEPVTELFLTNHTSIPSTIKPEEIVAANFTIGNRSATTQTYQYQVSLIGPEFSISLDKGSLTVASEKKQEVPVVFRLTQEELDALKNPIKVQISLQTGQQIHFWVKDEVQSELETDNQQTYNNNL